MKIDFVQCQVDMSCEKRFVCPNSVHCIEPYEGVDGKESKQIWPKWTLKGGSVYCDSYDQGEMVCS